MIITIISTFLISIIVHELAHLLVARKVGCKIEEVSIGFGKTLIQITYKGVVYKFKWCLFGGDCQLKGERKYIPNDTDAFCNLPYRKKLYIGIAGCTINLLMGSITLLLGIHYLNYPLFVFGFMNILLGIFNLLPIPCLDGSYLVFIWLEKLLGKEKGFNLFTKINIKALKFWIWINLLTFPFAIYYFIKTGKI